MDEQPSYHVGDKVMFLSRHALHWGKVIGIREQYEAGSLVSGWHGGQNPDSRRITTVEVESEAAAKDRYGRAYTTKFRATSRNLRKVA